MPNTNSPLREIYRNRDHSPLSRYQIRRIAPSAFAQYEDRRLSDKYCFISTDELLNRMESIGFCVMAAQEQYSQSDNVPTRKHMLRFAHRDELQKHRDEWVELIMMNSHNGSCAYRLMAGVFRQVCINGLVVGEQISSISVRHVGHDGSEVIDASLRLAAEMPRLTESIERMRGITLSYRRQLDFAREAAALRMANSVGQLATRSLLGARRADDIGFTVGGPATLWQCFNRIQENLVRGGLRVKLPARTDLRDFYSYRRPRSRHQELRPINGIDANTRLNRELWNLAERYAELPGTQHQSNDIIIP